MQTDEWLEDGRSQGWSQLWRGRHLQQVLHPSAENIPQNIPPPTCKYSSRYSYTHCCKYCPKYSPTHLLQILPQIFHHPPVANIVPNIHPTLYNKYCDNFTSTHLLQILPQIFDHPPALKLKISVKPCFLQMHFAWTLGQGLRDFIGNEYIWSSI